tara:strand:- start:140 stop:925 length:786 start_codon:yes stop_codon:yes gene_type:complete
MAKKNSSILGSIFKGVVDLTSEVIKTTYNAATSKTAQKIYKETSILTKDAVVGAAGLTKDVVVGAADFLNPSPKKKIIEYMENILLNMDYKKIHLIFAEQLKDTKSLSLEELGNKFTEQIKKIESEKFEEQIEDYKKEFKKIKSHWMAICTINLFSLIKDMGKKHPFIESDEFTKPELDEIWNTVVLNTIKEKNPTTVKYINKYYLGFELGNKDNIRKSLNIFLKECFGSDKVHPANQLIVMLCIKQAIDIHVEDIKKLLG